MVHDAVQHVYNLLSRMCKVAFHPPHLGGNRIKLLVKKSSGEEGRDEGEREGKGKREEGTGKGRGNKWKDKGKGR